MSGVELFLGGMAALAVASVVVKAKAGVRRAQAAADIARAGTSPVSLVGRVLVMALVIVGVQWLVLSHHDNVTLRWVVLGFPALVTAYTVTKALTVVEINPTRKGGGRR
jgi:predicted signal transduction protein with EAL and GGDEF domain